jgi:hypothetical protein
MSLVARVRSAYRKLLGRPPYDPDKYAAARDRDIDAIAALEGSNVERNFEKPKP